MDFMNRLRAGRSGQVDPAHALLGRDHYPYQLATHHAVLGSPMHGPFPADTATIYFGMGCFWGSEKKFWRLPGVLTTAVGYQGGFTPHPTYEEVCTGRTGHAENVLVVYNPEQVSTWDVLRTFWENHDPTAGDRQGNDIGTQYRSTVYWTTPEQERCVRDSAEAFGRALALAGWDRITTEMAPAAGRPFYYAEPYHQQYLFKVPNGYDCHSATGVELPH